MKKPSSVEFQFHYRETKGIARPLEWEENGRVRESVVHRGNLFIRRPTSRETSTLKKKLLTPLTNNAVPICFYVLTSVMALRI